MTIKITKQLATMEDLAIGSGTVVQERNGVPLTLTKIDFNSRVIRATSIAAMKALPSILGTAIHTLGYYSAGDGGGNIYEVVAGGTGTSDGGSFIDLDNGLQAKGIFSTGYIKGQQFGCFPELETVPLTDQTQQVLSALVFHEKLKLSLVFQSGTYLISPINLNGESLNIDILSSGGAAEFHVTQAEANAGAKTFEFSCLETVTDLTLTSDIVPGSKSLNLANTNNLAAGMVIEVRGSELWPFDVRDDKKGEIHTIAYISGLEVFIEDYTRDYYTIAEIEAVVSWVPGTLSIDGLSFVTNLPSPLVSTGGISLVGFNNPTIYNSTFYGQTFYALYIARCINARTENLVFKNIGRGLANGYGISDRSSLGNIHTNSYAYGCRRAYDAHSATHTPNRDWTVRGWRIVGGGGYFPDTSEFSWGLGTHGPSENGLISDCIISKVNYGVIARSKSTVIKNTTFIGPMSFCVTGRNGQGLAVQGCVYKAGLADNTDPLSWADIDSSLCITSMIQLNTPSSGGWDFSSPVVIEGNTAVGVVDSAFDFPSSEPARNLFISNNYIKAAPAPGTITLIGHNANISRSVLSNNEVDSLDREFLVFENNFDVGEADGIDSYYGVKVDGTTYATIGDNSYLRVPQINAHTLMRPHVLVTAPGYGYSGRELRVNSSSSSVLFEAGTWTALANAELFNGTYGTDGDISLGIHTSGYLSIENRVGSSGKFSIKKLA